MQALDNNIMRKVYIKYGSKITSSVIGCSQSHVCRVAKENNWPSPSGNDVHKLIMTSLYKTENF